MSKEIREPLFAVWFGNFYRPAFDDRAFLDASMKVIARLGFNCVELDSKAWEDFRDRFAGGEASDYVAQQEYMMEAAGREGLAYMFMALYLNGDNLYPHIRFSPPIHGESVTNADGTDGRWYKYWSEKARESQETHVARDVPMWARAGKIAEVTPELIALVNNAPDYNGKYYCVPAKADAPLGFFYNKAYFTEKGFEEPQTYEDFIKLCEAIKADGTMAPLVVGAADIWHVGFTWMQWYINYVTKVDPDFIKHLYTGERKWTEDFVAEGFKKYADIYLNGYVEEGFMSTSDSQIASFLVTGKAAMFFSGAHMVANIQDADPSFEFGWFPLHNEDGALNMWGGPSLNGWMYSTDCAADDDKLLAAQLWIKFCMRDDNYSYYLTTMSFLPVNDIQVDFGEIVNKMIATQKAAESNEPGWNSKWGDNEIPSAFRNFSYKIAQEWATGSKTIEQGLQEMQAEWDVETQSFNPVTGVGVVTE